MLWLIFEPHPEKTCLRVFRPVPTQTGLSTTTEDDLRLEISDKEVEWLYMYILRCSKNKGNDQLLCYRADDLPLCKSLFLHMQKADMQKADFLMMQLMLWFIFYSVTEFIHVLFTLLSPVYFLCFSSFLH